MTNQERVRQWQRLHVELKEARGNKGRAATETRRSTSQASPDGFSIVCLRKSRNSSSRGAILGTMKENVQVSRPTYLPSRRGQGLRRKRLGVPTRRMMNVHPTTMNNQLYPKLRPIPNRYPRRKERRKENLAMVAYVARRWSPMGKKTHQDVS